MSIFSCFSCSAPRIPKLRLHVDANRDGDVDRSTKNLDRWTWGKKKKGAVILCNNDDDNDNRDIPALAVGEARTLEDPRPVAGGHGLDNTNEIVDSDNDVPDLAPLGIIRHARSENFPAGWKARLTVSHPEKIRIFRRANRAQVIGPRFGAATLAVHNIANLNPAVMNFRMEAVDYPSTGFDGYIDLTLEVLDDNDLIRDTHVARVRVAPWIALHHLNPVSEVYVLNDGNQFDHNLFRDDLEDAVTDAGLAAPTEGNGGRYRRDRWFRDIMKVGFASMPHPHGRGEPRGRHVPTILRTPNDRDLSHGSLLDRYPWREMVGRDVGYTSPRYPFINGSSLNSYGNLECSPPVKVNGRKYKFGRIVYGNDMASRMDLRIRRFLEAQAVQAPFSIDTSWLTVGHVDEVMSFCPMHSAKKKFKVLLASPAVAVQILQNLQNNGNGAAQLCVAPQADGNWAGGNYPHLTVNAVLGNVGFMDMQDGLQHTIDGIETRLRTELGLSARDIVKLPVLFREEVTIPGKHISYLPNPVNMLVVTKNDGRANLCIPKPYGPEVGVQCQFERDIRHKLRADYDINLVRNKGRIYFIDDFFTYHESSGEIHCGTNEKRTPPDDQWWWELDWMV